MKKALALITIIALLPGCTEEDMKTWNPPTPPPTPGPLTTPEGVQARRLSEVLERHRKTIDGNIQDVTSVVRASMTEKDFADIKAVVALQKSASTAVNSTHQMGEELIELGRELRHGVNDFASYARSFRNRAEDFDDESMRQSELSWATHYERLVVELPKERERVAAFAECVPPLLDFTRQSKRFLDGYALFLATYHDGTFPTSEAARYQSGYKRFISQFEQFQKLIDAYRGTKNPWKPTIPGVN